MTPLVYTPTEVVLVDDHDLFLKTLATNLDTARLTYSFFIKPQLALAHINQPRENNHSLSAFEEILEPTGYSTVAMRYKVGNLHKSVFSKDRFNDISVVIADYSMPSMNGLEFLDKIQNPHVKKILLTGVADERIAVDAFNQKRIHKYIQKSAPNFIDDILSSIEHFSTEYWYQKTLPIEQFVSTNFKSSPFDNNAFVTYFQKIQNQYSIAEYYLLEGSFRFLLVDAHGKKYTLWIQSKEEADSYAFELNALNDTEIPPTLKQAVDEYRKNILPTHSKRSITTALRMD